MEKFCRSRRKEDVFPEVPKTYVDEVFLIPDLFLGTNPMVRSTRNVKFSLFEI